MNQPPTTTRTDGASDPASFHVIRPGTSADAAVYGVVEGPLAAVDLGRSLPRGSILVIRPHADLEAEALHAAIERVAYQVANASLALWLDIVDRRRSVRTALNAAQLGIQIVIPSPEPPTALLRNDLTEPSALSSVLLLWLRRRGLEVQPATREVLRQMIGRALEDRSLEEFAKGCGTNRRTIARLFGRERMGSAARWFTALRAVAIANTIQRNPGERGRRQGWLLERSRAQRSAGGGDGGSAPEIRRLLGWQWILVDAMRRLGIRIVDSGH